MIKRWFQLTLAVALLCLVLLPGTGSASTMGQTRTPEAGTADTGGTVTPGDSDGDGVLDDDDNCPAWPNVAQGLPSWSLAGNDDDCDGFNADVEAQVGTDPAKHCPATTMANDEPTDAWPTDFNDSRTTNLSDLILIGPSYNKSNGQVGYNQRFDLNASNSVNLSDVILMGPFYNKNCNDPPLSSEALIAAALDAGSITYEESLRYRAYALYDHPDLPPQFRSPVIDLEAAIPLFAEVLENQATLSPQLLADLEPFTARPADPISIFNNPPQAQGMVSATALAPWVSQSAAGGKVRVWVRDGAGAAAALSNYAAKSTEVWPKLQAIFPFDNPDTPGAADVNPDSAIDIYFVSMGEVDPRWAGCGTPPCGFSNGGGGYANYVAPISGNKSASAIMIDRSITGTLLTSDIAHELMHVGQHSYDYEEPFWLKDSTAQWGAERVLMELGLATAPELNYLLTKFFDGLNRKLTRDSSDDQNRYGAWLFFFFASMNEGDGIVTSVWQQAAAPGVQNENAVDLAYPFVDNFDDFAAQNWNQAPVDPLYKGPPPSSPLFQSGLKPKLHLTKNFTTTFEEVNTDRPSPLSARYYRYTFASNVRKVTFLNDLGGNQDAHIWAIKKIGGVWKPPEDWSKDQKKRFCRDFPDEDLQEVIIILSNSNKTNNLPAGSKLRTQADTESCKGWIGTATGTYHWDDGYQEDWTATAHILWEEDPDFLFGCGCRTFFPTGEIDWLWEYGYDSAYSGGDPCHEVDSGRLQAGEGLAFITDQMLILWEDPGDPNQYLYSADGPLPVSWYSECEEGTRYEGLIFIDIPAPDIIPVTPTPIPTPPPTPPGPAVAARLQAATVTGTCDAVPFSLPRDATSFSGSCYDQFFNDPNHSLRYDWSFTRLGPP